MTLYDLIMTAAKFTKMDWSRLGKAEIDDEETIGRMLMEGYEAVADED
ncbi:hypothetical protein [uncultured Halomonas sp.]|nr:hypothetical protein [uncultured Halomonas sp.]